MVIGGKDKLWIAPRSTQLGIPREDAAPTHGAFNRTGEFLGIYPPDRVLFPGDEEHRNVFCMQASERGIFEDIAFAQHRVDPATR